MEIELIPAKRFWGEVVMTHQPNKDIDVGRQHPTRNIGIRLSLALACFSAAYGLTVGAQSAGFPGKTQASPELQRDTWQLLQIIDTASAPSCQSRKVIDTKVTKPLSGLKFRKGIAVAGKWSERWTISGCGTKTPYTIDYVIDPRGGTFISVKPIGR